MSVRTAAAKLMILSMLLGVSAPQALAAGNAQAGKAASMVCASCHGQDGASAIDPSYPQLAGQNERYLAKQLKMFQSGERDVALMTAQLIGKSEQDLDDLAAYYASLPAKSALASGSDDEIAHLDDAVSTADTPAVYGRDYGFGEFRADVGYALPHLIRWVFDVCTDAEGAVAGRMQDADSVVGSFQSSPSCLQGNDGVLV